MVREMLLSEELLKEYVELFRGKSEAELDELAKSFLLCMSSFLVVCEV